jgi:ABC-type sugar transport system permease subunit
MPSHRRGSGIFSGRPWCCPSWRNIYDPTNGLINRFLRAAFDPGFTHGWLSDPRTALGAILFIGFPFVSSTSLLIFSAGLEEIPAEIYDAANIEGASFLTRTLNIDLPYCIPHFRLIVVSGFSGIIANYAAVLLLTQGRPLNSTMVPGYYLYRAGADQRFGLASAVGDTWRRSRSSPRSWWSSSWRCSPWS